MMLRRDHMRRPARLWLTDAGKKKRATGSIRSLVHCIIENGY